LIGYVRHDENFHPQWTINANRRAGPEALGKMNRVLFQQTGCAASGCRGHPYFDIGIKGFIIDIHHAPAMGFLKQQHGPIGLERADLLPIVFGHVYVKK
jgi:hypothetical protein